MSCVLKQPLSAWTFLSGRNLCSTSKALSGSTTPRGFPGERLVLPAVVSNPHQQLKNRSSGSSSLNDGAALLPRAASGKRTSSGTSSSTKTKNEGSSFSTPLHFRESSQPHPLCAKPAFYTGEPGTWQIG